MNNQYLFVYGSLKKEFHNHKTLLKEKCEFVKGGCFTLDTFEMYPSKDYQYPYLFKTNRDISKKIEGELYLVSEQSLLALDIFEGVLNGLYERELVDILIDKKTDKTVLANIYISNATDVVLSDTDIAHPCLSQWTIRYNKIGLLMHAYITSKKAIDEI